MNRRGFFGLLAGSVGLGAPTIAATDEPAIMFKRPMCPRCGCELMVPPFARREDQVKPVRVTCGQYVRECRWTGTVRFFEEQR